MDCTQDRNNGEQVPGAAGQVPRLQERERHRRPPRLLLLGAADPQPDHDHGRRRPDGRISFSKRYCVPNSAGPAQEERLGGPLLGSGAGEPGRERPAGVQHRRARAARPATASSSTGATTATAATSPVTATRPTAGSAQRPRPTSTGNASGHPMYHGPAPIVASAAPWDGSSTARWWTDNTYNGDERTPSARSSSAAAATARPVPVLQRSRTRCGRLLPARSAGNNFPIYTMTGSSSGPGRA